MAAVPPAVAVAIAVAINPCDQGINALDFNWFNNVKFYQKDIKGLDESEQYDLSPGKFKSFLHNLRQRSDVYGWNGVLNVPPIVIAPAVPVLNHILDSYGTISMAACTAHATAYMTARHQTTQNAAMLYHFLFVSLTLEARNEVNVDPISLTVMIIKDVLCFLRIIITKAQLDTIGTLETWCSNLGELPVRLVDLSGNIIAFHQHVNTLTNALDSYGQTYPELIINLFKAYKQIEDREFSTYIMVTRIGYNANPNAYQSRNLMEGVKNNYKLAVEAGTWSPNLAKKQIKQNCRTTSWDWSYESCIR
jgi:hypothetical protein